MNVTDRLVEVMARAADPEFFSVFDGLSEPSDSAWSARAAILARHSAALTALRKAEEEVGWRCVPKELEMAMYDAGRWSDSNPPMRLDLSWQAMLSAAPLPPGSTE